MRDHSRKSRLLLFIGLFGAALLYGDGVITPAISGFLPLNCFSLTHRREVFAAVIRFPELFLCPPLFSFNKYALKLWDSSFACAVQSGYGYLNLCRQDRIHKIASALPSKSLPMPVVSLIAGAPGDQRELRPCLRARNSDNFFSDILRG